jgi:hypothetical protein
MNSAQFAKLPKRERQHFTCCFVCNHYYDKRHLDEVVFHNLNGHNPHDRILPDISKSWRAQRIDGRDEFERS